MNYITNANTPSPSNSNKFVKPSPLIISLGTWWLLQFLCIKGTPNTNVCHDLTDVSFLHKLAITCRPKINRKGLKTQHGITIISCRRVYNKSVQKTSRKVCFCQALILEGAYRIWWLRFGCKISSFFCSENARGQCSPK